MGQTPASMLVGRVATGLCGGPPHLHHARARLPALDPGDRPIAAASLPSLETARLIADRAIECLLLELATFPKPGLVSHVDRGSHTDMDAETFRASARAIRPYLRDLAAAGAAFCGMDRLREIGLAAEFAMMEATGGVNTHRGAIFGLGLLCAAAGAREAGLDLPLGRIVALLWSPAILAAPTPQRTHGGSAYPPLRCRRRPAGGGVRLCNAVHGRPAGASAGAFRLPGRRGGRSRGDLLRVDRGA